MIKKWLIIILTCAPLLLGAQVNLVKNGGFEQYIHCPYDIDQIGFAKYWGGLDSNLVFSDSFRSIKYTWCLPEYCNACDTINYIASVPSGGVGYYQKPRSGNGFSEVRTLDDTSVTHNAIEYRDYLQGRFTQKLSAGKNYCVTFYANLVEASIHAIKELSAYIDNGTINNTDSLHCPEPKISFTPQITAISVINDTFNWVKIQGSYTAMGNERFITMGNFSDFDNTTKINVYYTGSAYGYTFYLIDDVSVIASDAVADAGSNKSAGVGDSVWIGTHEEGMPCTWYLAGDTTHAVGYGGGIKVKLTATGTYRYIVMLDLCGHVTLDTMTLTVWPAGVYNVAIGQFNDVTMYPNPATQSLTIAGAKNCDLQIINPVGQLMYTSKLTQDEATINIALLPQGNYFVVITDAVTGYKVVRQVVKE